VDCFVALLLAMTSQGFDFNPETNGLPGFNASAIIEV
jgi:hypothetical protein